MAEGAGQRPAPIGDVQVRNRRPIKPKLSTYKDQPMFIDEVQRGGDPLVLAIKAAVDRRSHDPGQFVLAGSSRFLTIPTLTESLAGRVRIIDLWPFSQGEIDGAPDGLVDALFGPTQALRAVKSMYLSRAEVFSRVVRGGLPAAVALRTARSRRDFFDSYVTTPAERDLVELRTPRRAVDVRRMLALVLARTYPQGVGRDDDGHRLTAPGERDLVAGEDALDDFRQGSDAPVEPEGARAGLRNGARPSATARTLAPCSLSTSLTSTGATTGERCRSCGRRSWTRSSEPSIRSR